MRKLILQEFVSIDGFAADAEGSTAFFEHFTGETGREIDNDLLNFISTIDTILLGANTYKMFVDFWPTPLSDPEIVADALNATPKIVFSKSLDATPWGKYEPVQLVQSDAGEAVRQLKLKPGKDMVLWGSLLLAQSLLKENLVDEVQLRVCPVALGKGIPLFAKMDALNFTLQESRVYKCGVVFLNYKPV